MVSTAALPYDELVEQIREAWADVLGSDRAQDVPLEQNFLEAGGNSLLLVMLWEQLQPLASRPVKLSELFTHATVQAQAELLARRPDADAVAPPEQSAQRSLLASRRAAAGSGGAA